MTLATLRTSLKSNMKINGTAYDTEIDDAIRSALRQLRGKRFWFLKTTDTLSLVGGDNSVALPTNFSAPEEFEIICGGVRKSDGYGFDFLTYDNLKRDYYNTDPLSTGEPLACAVLDNTLYVSHLSNDDYSIEATYYKQDVTLPLMDADTSVWFDEGYDVVRSLAMFIFKRDAKGFTVTKEDGSMADYFMRALDDQHAARFGGR